jgi:hypothetical protein
LRERMDRLEARLASTPPGPVPKGKRLRPATRRGTRTLRPTRR